MRILFLPGSLTSAAARFRLLQFVEPLHALGHRVEVRVPSPDRHWSMKVGPVALRRAVGFAASVVRVASLLDHVSSVHCFDVIVCNRDLVPNSRVRFLEPLLAKHNPRLIFDFDDAIFLGSRGAKLELVLPCFRSVTAGNATLAAFARRVHSDVHVWPTVVDCSFYQPAPQRSAGPVRLGWSGSRATFDRSLPLLKNVVQRLSQRRAFELWIHSEMPPHLDWPGVELRYVPWRPDTELSGLRKIDIGLMPLLDEPFERGKCGLKALRYGAMGVPTIASPVGVARGIVRDGETGFLCSGEDRWEAALQLLMDDACLRRVMGEAARCHVEANYSLQSMLPRMTELLEQVRG